MTIDRTRINEALTCILQDDEYVFWSGPFFDFSHRLSASRLNTLPEIRYINKNLSWIKGDLSSLIFITERMEWQKRLRLRRILEEDLWFFFSHCDITIFLVFFRSIFDYVNNIIRTKALYPKGLKGKRKTFTELRNWLKRKPQVARKQIGEDWSNFLLSCDWYENIKDPRDLAVHRGIFIASFLVNEKIHFQMFSPKGSHVIIPEVMENHFMVNFELYAGLYYAYLLSFLNEFSIILHSKIQIKDVPEKLSIDDIIQLKQKPILYTWMKEVAQIQKHS